MGQIGAIHTQIITKPATRPTTLMHMPVILPHVRLCVVRGERECSLHAGQGHVVLLRVEAAEAEVVEQLCVVDAHLEEAAVEAEGQLRLVRVKVVHADARDALHVDRVLLQGGMKYTSHILAEEHNN